MKFTIALTIAIVSMAFAKPTPRNDLESSEERTTTTTKDYQHHRRHTGTPTDSVDIGTKGFEHHRRHTGTPAIATEKSTSILEDVVVTQHPAAVHTRAADVPMTKMETEDVTAGEFVFTSGNSHATIEVVTVRP
ncbi:hypothetical protein Aduo_014424 [Ancylostoma duodenale]